MATTRNLTLGYSSSSKRIRLSFKRTDSNYFNDDLIVTYGKYDGSSYDTLQNTNISPTGFYAWKVRIKSASLTPTQLLEYLTTNNSDLTFNVSGDYIYLGYKGLSYGTDPLVVFSGIGSGNIDPIIAITSSTPMQTQATATVENNLSHCSVNPILSTITEDTSYSLTFTPDNDYSFTIAPTLTYTDANNMLQQLTATVTASGDSATLSFNLSSLKDGSIVSVNATAVATTDYSVTLVKNTSNIIITQGDTDTIQNGSNVYIKFSLSSNDYTFENIPTLVYTDESDVAQTINATNDGIHNYYIIQVDDISVKRNSQAILTALGVNKKATFNYSGIVNATIQPDDIQYYERGIFQETDFTITADSGFYFNSTVTATYTSNNATRTINGVINQNRLTATITIPDDLPIDHNTTINFNASAIAVELENNVNTIYLPTDKQLHDVAQKRYYTLTGIGETSFSASQVDLAQYILSLRKFFVDLPNDFTSSVILGYYNTNIVCKVFNSGYSLDVDCGNRTITGIFNNSLDFTDSIITADLPFIGVVTLNADKVMNRVINLKYKANIISGDCMAIISDVVTHSTLYTFNGKCSIDIPYILTYSNNGVYQEIKGGLDADNLALYQVSPRITIRQHEIIANNRYGNNTIIYDVIGSYTGHTVIEDVDIDNILATDTEKAMIDNLLTQGIIL